MQLCDRQPHQRCQQDLGSRKCDQRHHSHWPLTQLSLCNRSSRRCMAAWQRVQRQCERNRAVAGGSEGHYSSADNAGSLLCCATNARRHACQACHAHSVCVQVVHQRPAPTHAPDTPRQTRRRRLVARGLCRDGRVWQRGRVCVCVCVCVSARHARRISHRLNTPASHHTALPMHAHRLDGLMLLWCLPCAAMACLRLPTPVVFWHRSPFAVQQSLSALHLDSTGAQPLSW
jgi:hypothetical protein